MTEYSTIKVTKKTLQELHKFVGKLKQLKGERVSMEDAINYLLNEHKKYENRSPEFVEKLNKDREQFLKLLQQGIKGAGPEDYKEYGFEDV